MCICLCTQLYMHILRLQQMLDSFRYSLKFWYLVGAKLINADTVKLSAWQGKLLIVAILYYNVVLLYQVVMYTQCTQYKFAFTY